MPTSRFPSRAAAVPAPLYAQVKQTISEKIYTGCWRPNDRIPSEAELVQQFGFSRMTVNRALRELTSEGLLVRLQGVGTFVAESKGQSALFKIVSIAEEIRQRQHQHCSKVIELSERKADLQQASSLGVQPGDAIFHSLIVHYENDIPLQIEDRLVNATVVPDYLKQDFTQMTPHDYLSLVAPLTEGEHIVEAVVGTSQQCQLLNIDKNEPCLFIHRRTWSTQDIVSSAKLLSPGCRHRLTGRFKS
ncbi:HTH-type transcriptional repressor yvoA [Pragia fontium]|uniref:histidine utilization repressor n=1 Tax=Pragia fontium TaxID=82985 RepID=UPI000E07BEFA|nr:histidine utilization repressor [Pragia fontium]SUB83460.1 HTH-type transcriptional repressor yvoA [Pragia fontium]